jgi:hypothetical protein
MGYGLKAIQGVRDFVVLVKQGMWGGPFIQSIPKEIVTIIQMG